MEVTKDIKIKNRRISLIISIIGVVLSVLSAGVLVFLIVFLSVYQRAAGIWAVLAIPAVTAGVSVFGVVVYFKEEFTFKDGNFTYIRIFKKPKSINIQSIEYIAFTSVGPKIKVQFVNKKAEVALSFLDDGVIANNDDFLNALIELKIPVKSN